MSEIFIGTLVDVEALAAKIDTAEGYPCCPCVASTDPSCTCARHVYPDGRRAPHHGSRTLRHAIVKQHKTDPAQWGYPVDERVKAIARDGTPLIDPRTKDEIAAEAAKAIAPTADWADPNVDPETGVVNAVKPETEAAEALK